MIRSTYIHKISDGLWEYGLIHVDYMLTGRLPRAGIYEYRQCGPTNYEARGMTNTYAEAQLKRDALEVS